MEASTLRFLIDADLCPDFPIISIELREYHVLYMTFIPDGRDWNIEDIQELINRVAKVDRWKKYRDAPGRGYYLLGYMDLMKESGIEHSEAGVRAGVKGVMFNGPEGIQ